MRRGDMIRIGVICPSEIAFRRFLPALKKVSDLEYAGVAYASKEEWVVTSNSMAANESEKARTFQEAYGGNIYTSYEQMICSDEIDAVYIPLPPALHYKWAKRAIEEGKHILVEKPFTINLGYTEDLMKQAASNKIAVHENYMFVYHNQLKVIEEIIKSGEIGEVRLYRITFGFPRRKENDFRYNKLLGGGAFLDCGGYTIKFAAMLLGPSAKVAYSNLNYVEGQEVDIYGSGSIINDQGVTVQLAFGMDNDYKCELEVWGSKGTLISGRILTAPVDFVPECIIRKGKEEKKISLPADDTFFKSILRFKECIHNDTVRNDNYQEIVSQAALAERFLLAGGKNDET